jgi:uncharacterized delta-60 repeat protein
MLVLLLVTVVFGLLGVPAVAAAAPGDLDASFGSGGVRSLASGTQLFGVAVQSDREVVAVGSSGSSLLVERFSAVGAPEGAFAAGGGVGRAVVVQPDGKIVVAGNDGAGMLVERFNANGSRDGGFGSGGVVHAVSRGSANAVALGPNGSIVAAGAVPGADAFQRIAVLRLNANGSPDGSLGPGGVHVVDLGQDSIARGVAVQGDGKIVLAGQLGPGAHQVVNGLIARVTSSGALDPGFGSGQAFVYFPQSGGAAVTFNAVALDPAGGIVVGGGGTTTNQSEAVFVRLSCAGALDRSFAGSGLEVTPSSRGFVTDPIGANGVAVAGGRRVVGAGEFRDSGLRSAALWGFEPNGVLDFGNTAPDVAESNALAVDSAGDLVVAGSNVPAGFAPSGFVARYSGFGGPASGTRPCGGVSPAVPSLGPTVTTGPASGMTTSKAEVSGSANPNGQTTSYHFDYGTSIAYGSQTSAASAGSGSAAIAVSARLSGLASNTTYHYRLVASNAAGVSHGTDRTFRTSNQPLPRPVLSKVSQSNRVWGESVSRTHTRPVGTTFSFRLNERARVVFAFTQQVRGRKVNGTCVTGTTRNRRKPFCKRTVTRGTLSFTGQAGINKHSFRGRISRSNELKPGTYKLVITARTAAQNSRSQSITFTIVS